MSKALAPCRRRHKQVDLISWLETGWFSGRCLAKLVGSYLWHPVHALYIGIFAPFIFFLGLSFGRITILEIYPLVHYTDLQHSRCNKYGTWAIFAEAPLISSCFCVS